MKEIFEKSEIICNFEYVISVKKPPCYTEIGFSLFLLKIADGGVLLSDFSSASKEIAIGMDIYSNIENILFAEAQRSN